VLQDVIGEGRLLAAAAAAFAGGVLSFFLPCVLPLVPAYLSFVTGSSIQDLQESMVAARVRLVVGRTVAFILGFSVIYTAVGAAAGALGDALDILNNVWATRAAGLLLILMGVHLTGLLKIAALHRELRMHVSSRPASVVGAFLVGMAFAFGWSPCTGPVVAAILTLAVAEETVGRGVFLLALYSLGLGVPFLLSAVAINLFLGLFQRVKRWLGVVEIGSGVILIALGVLLLLNQMGALIGSVERLLH
jgi:cytochrome c-type biogenesis protein